MAVFRITNPYAFGYEPLANLIAQAVVALSLGKPAEILLDLASLCADPKTGLFVGATEAEELKCFLGVFLPPNRLVQAPQFYGAFNLGPKALWKATFAEGVKFAQAAGYNTIWALNGSGKSDKVYCRALGMEAAPVGSVLEYKIK